MDNNSLAPQTQYKLGRVLADYDLLDMHDDLPEMWTGERAMSLRDLAETINIAITKKAMQDAGEDPLEGEAENTYRLLTGDEVSPGVQTQQRKRLERKAVDVETLESDYVSHQAVYTYLTEGLELSKEALDDTEPIEKHDRRIRRLQNRATAVMENTLEELEAAGEVTLGPTTCTVDMNVYCQDCHRQYQMSELLENGGCDCE